jgi:hypothetical protein
VNSDHKPNKLVSVWQGRSFSSDPVSADIDGFSCNRQYVSPRGNIPLQRVNDIVDRAPAPPTVAPARGMFPKEYHNQ